MLHNLNQYTLYRDTETNWISVLVPFVFYIQQKIYLPAMLEL